MIAEALALAAKLDAAGVASEAQYLRDAVAEGWLREKDIDSATVTLYCA